MPTVHTLDLYPHTGGHSCLGCTTAEDGDAPDAGGAAASASAPTGAHAGGAAGTAGSDAGAAPPPPEPGAPHLVEVQVLGASGTPQPQLPLALTLPDGTAREASTGADGYLRLSVTPQVGQCRLRLADAPPAVAPPPGATPPAGPPGVSAGGRPILGADGVDVPIGTPHVVELPPRVVRCRLTGILFETDKSFVLPAALAGLRVLVRFYEAHPGLAVLVVGHTDTDGKRAENLALSRDRADAVAALLRDDVDALLGWYGEAKPKASRWGTREDQHMLSALHDGTAPFYVGPVQGEKDAITCAAVERFQQWSNAQQGTALAVDGDAGPATRRELLSAYLGIDGTSLPKGVALESHGCGENHPEEPVGEGIADARNRRVDVFLFEGPVDPPPRDACPHPGCDEYALWRAAVAEEIDVRDPLVTPPDAPKPLKLRLVRRDAPVALAAYVLTMHGGAGGEGGEVRNGTTDERGGLVELLPAGVAAARLSVPAEGLDLALDLGKLPPLEELAGVQARLCNLGYGCLEEGVLDETTRCALVAFQCDHDVPVTGKNDALTRQKLLAVHGS